MAVRWIRGQKEAKEPELPRHLKESVSEAKSQSDLVWRLLPRPTTSPRHATPRNQNHNRNQTRPGLWPPMAVAIAPGDQQDAAAGRRGSLQRKPVSGATQCWSPF
ncbi:GD19067 [Drosophila simulans]|uniref:GD19067 n=1 Tax=Drosophila simulans TaxID=7240 RepID=B4QXR4_DROSI|nr:GD19067 [Drosophila simulans]